MDETIRLHCRITELETLLRLKEEQLNEARVATNVLVTLISKSGSHFQNGALAGHQRLRLDGPARNIHTATPQEDLDYQQRARIDVAGGYPTPAHIPKHQMQTPRQAHLDLLPSPPLTSSLSVGPIGQQQADLLGLEDDNVFTDTTSSGQGNLAFSATKHRVLVPHTADHGQDRISSRPIVHANGRTSYVVAPAAWPADPEPEVREYRNRPDPEGLMYHTRQQPEDQEYRANQTRPVRPAMFANHEHNSLMGAACYIEEMTPDEQNKHWEEYRRKQGSRHTAQEWQAYYESEVRPRYLSKTQLRSHEVDRTQDSAVINDQSGKSEPSSAFSGSSPRQEGREVNVDHAAKTRSLPTNGDGLDLAATITSEDRLDIGTTKEDPLKIADRVNSLAVDEDSASLHKHAAQLLRQRKSEDEADVDGKVPDQTANATPSDPSPASAQVHERRSYGPPHEVAELWQYRARFNAERHKHLFRTVVISGVPCSVKLADVLDTVRGGKIMHAHVIETSVMKTTPAMETNTVEVTFCGAYSAQIFVERCLKIGLTHTSEKPPALTRLTVKLHPFPSPSVAIDFQRDVHQYGMTRMLFVNDEGKWTPEDLVARMADTDYSKHQMCKSPLRAGRDADGIIVLEYPGMVDAAYAWHIIERNPDVFGEVSKGFYPDPCGRPLEDAEPKVSPAKDVEDSHPPADSAIGASDTSLEFDG